MIWRVKLKLLRCLLIEPQGSICCPSILFRHWLFPLFSFLKLPLDLSLQSDCVRSATFCVYCWRRCLATCIPRSRDFFLSFGNHNLRSGIFSCNTSSTFGVSVFLVSDDFPVLYDQAFKFFLIKLLKVGSVITRTPISTQGNSSETGWSSDATSLLFPERMVLISYYKS